ncbi:alpha/beta-Hydrolases superfamily protein [Raphanus sativus]|uniref:Pheophytinase, chloroplastic-like n=1 Tax=Raphanus sativus TaxID=3726 RepID=A0A6J0MCZ3_RAPSA|nr:pheophytinase, chloroplastic-like [Raphanus sativus]KAJ4913883.1 alpha/beta-Hydrolases superfamily protein [Raphanus sativus]
MSASCAVTPSVRTELFSSLSKSPTFPAQTRRPSNKCEISRRGFAVRGGIVASGVSVMGTPPSPPSAASQPIQGGERLAFKPEGYNFWEWRGHKIHYVVQGEGLPLVLIHGFGASVFHWRYNIPELAKKYKVYALDLLGFGWSDKALIEYDAMVWTDQVIDFIKEIVKEPSVVVGNSLGGFTALSVAVGLPEQVTGVALLNSAGQFASESRKQEEAEEPSALTKFIVKPLKEIFQRVVLGFLFWQAKQPSRIESVLKSVYINAANVDDYLVESISKPATDPNAGEVYYRLMTRFLTNQSRYTLDSVLSKMTCPLLLLWGDLDPWVGPAKAEKIKAFYSNSSLVHLQAGHCPHDEVPEAVNVALLDWLSNVVSKPSSPEVSEV